MDSHARAGRPQRRDERDPRAIPRRDESQTRPRLDADFSLDEGLRRTIEWYAHFFERMTLSVPRLWRLPTCPCSGRSASTPLANALVEPQPTLGDSEETFPLNLVRCRQCTLVQIDETVPPEKLFSALRVLLVVLGHDARAMRRRSPSAWCANVTRARRAWSWRSPATTVTCCSITRRRACRSSASSRRRTSPRSHEQSGIRTLSRTSSGPTSRTALAAEGDAPTSSTRTTSSRTWRTCRVSSQALPGCSAPDGRRRDRSAVREGFHRTLRVRHDLPRAFVLFLDVGARSIIRRAQTPCRAR